MSSVFNKEQILWTKSARKKDEPLFIYRYNDQLSTAPEHCFWRLMTEHPSLRVYQLEVEED
ncbi:hypothetical protein [Anabaena lutea]|uniref:Uncharacterized protein n=1 Tax=Anabaena lutea FACHB-196 TaxID=2692881 RepID=A0ABR8FME3_9NOST|nr:hypothetical protein [Anabaena lutea]MBD2569876.1 hypothetical protein [Anabaena lutea FACHB-196]